MSRAHAAPDPRHLPPVPARPGLRRPDAAGAAGEAAAGRSGRAESGGLAARRRRTSAAADSRTPLLSSRLGLGGTCKQRSPTALHLGLALVERPQQLSRQPPEPPAS
ncbi:uncharacterized protein PS065_016593 [Dugong dugon]